ncbi:hypothetical protein V2G26_019299 [Clonostachys chloroleuca]
MSPQQERDGWMTGFFSLLFLLCVSLWPSFWLYTELRSARRRNNSNNRPDEERDAEPRDAADARRPSSAPEAPPVPVHIHLNAINPWRRGHEEHAAPVDREPAPQDGSSQDTLVQPRPNSRHGSERGQTRAWW